MAIDRVADEIRTRFAANLTQAREEAKLSISDVARAYGCTPSWISRLESGAREPSLTTIVRLARVVHVEPTELMRGIR
jgi:transcriptional regulator with XRE-family HTH domain